MTVSASPGHDYRVVPERLNIEQDVLEASIARGCGQQPALVGDFGVVTYEALQRRVNAVAAGLLDLGLTRGELVLIKMSNSPEFAVAFLAAVKLGVIPVLVNSLLTAVELTAVLEQTRPQLIFTEASRSGAVRQLRESGLFKHVVCSGEIEGSEIPFAALEGNSSTDRWRGRYSKRRACFHRLHFLPRSRCRWCSPRHSSPSTRRPPRR